MELFSPKIKNSYIFSKKKKKLYFAEWNFIAPSHPKEQNISIFEKKFSSHFRMTADQV